MKPLSPTPCLCNVAADSKVIPNARNYPSSASNNPASSRPIEALGVLVKLFAGASIGLLLAGLLLALEG